MSDSILQPTTLGILGGGQLAQLMCDAARGLGVDTLVLSPDAEAPARQHCSQFIHARYEDPDALHRLAQQASVITLDNEHIPLESLSILESQAELHPGARIMARLQDRLAQRGLLVQLDLPQTRFWSVDKTAAVHSARLSARFPAVLKRRRQGYDGHGQRKVESPEELENAWIDLGRSPCILESWVDHCLEFSIVGARNAQDEQRLFPPIANQHQAGQLRRSELPADLPAEIRTQAEAIWRRLALALNYCGVLSIEFFLTDRGEVLINEIAPRVHNSGHVTQHACENDQFDLHVRAVLGLPLPELAPAKRGVMYNLYPQHGIHDLDQARHWQDSIGGKIYLYGKTPKPRRKLGHWLLAPEQADAAGKALAAHEAADTAD